MTKLLRALLACFVLGVPTVADARIETLRWINADPDPSRIDGYVVYSGLESRNYDTRIDLGWMDADVDGVFVYDLVVIPENDSVYVAVAAYDGNLESTFSNEQLRVVPEPSLVLQLVSGGIGLVWLHRRRIRKGRSNGPS